MRKNYYSQCLSNRHLSFGGWQAIFWRSPCFEFWLTVGLNGLAMLFRNLQGISRVILAALLIAIIAVIDWRVEVNIAFGFFYIFPILLLGTVMSRWQILLTVLLCTFLADYFDPFPFTLRIALPQDFLVFAALAGAGFFSHELTRSRRQETADLQKGEKEVA